MRQISKRKLSSTKDPHMSLQEFPGIGRELCLGASCRQNQFSSNSAPCRDESGPLSAIYSEGPRPHNSDSACALPHAAHQEHRHAPACCPSDNEVSGLPPGIGVRRRPGASALLRACCGVLQVDGDTRILLLLYPRGRSSRHTRRLRRCGAARHVSRCSACSLSMHGGG